MKVKNVAPQTSITFSTKPKLDTTKSYQWWKAANKKDLGQQLLSTAAYVKNNQNYRFKQATVYAKLYGNQALFSFIGANMSKMDQMAGLPADRPTFNLVQSCIDTLVSRISQNRPAPVFLTNNGDYKERKIAKQGNNFILGEFHREDVYEKAAQMLRDALVEGTGILKVYEGQDDTVKVERRLCTELMVDANEAIYGEPRTLYEVKLVDRDVLKEAFPGHGKDIDMAEQAYTDNSVDASKTVSDLVLVVEAWRLPSGKGARDGRHTIACSSGVIFDEEWSKSKFPFVFLHYAPRLLGFWSQGLAEQLMGTQMEINSMLFTISRAIKLVGVPRVFVEDGSKVVSSHFNNEIGSIIKYQGTKPIYEVAQCVPQELYAQLQRLIQYGYQQSGVSALDASAQKPAGLNSGEAIRAYDDISTDRFALLSRRYDNAFVDLAYLITETAKDIVERTGKYQTIYPNKNGTKQVDFPDFEKLENEYVIQCYNMSSLPKDPAGRMAKITEMIQGGMITIKEGRRLLDYPDLEQDERLANASEERIFQYLDEIVEEGKYTGPDPFMDLPLASELAVQYYNLYVPAKLEEEKAQMIRDFWTQAQALLQEASAPPPGMQPPAPGMPTAPGGAQIQPQAAAQPLPQSPLVPNAVQ